MLRLNLGCSDDHRAGYWNVDCAAPADQIVDLRDSWPWLDSSVDEIYAHDVFEHLWNLVYLGNRGKIWAMNEAHRVLRPGGRLDLAVPCAYLSASDVPLANALPKDVKPGPVNPGAFADPTHVSFWTLDDRYYFGEEWNNPQGERGRLGPAYGIKALFRGEWRLHEYGAGPERRAKVLAMLEAVK